MKSTEEHRIKLKEVADLALNNGIVNSEIDVANIEDFSKLTEEEVSKFIADCHTGYKEAQKLIISEIMDYQTELTELKTKLKEANKKRDKEGKKKIIVEQKIIENRIASFSHIADTIAWSLIGHQISTARRLYINEEGSKYLSNSNISHAIEVADSINENPNDFALISDITNFVQIGDLLIRKNGQIGIMELKQGSVNDEIAEFLADLENKNQSIDDVNLEEEFDKTTVKQVKRVVRQKTRMNQVTTLVNDDEGVDPVSGETLKIQTPVLDTQYYLSEFNGLREQLDSKDWAYGVVEACLHIGLYKGKCLKLAPFTIKSILETDTKNYILVDWMSIINNLSEPIFAKPFPPDFIIDVITGKIKVIIGLNLDLMIELFNSIGLQASWMTSKQTAKIKQDKLGNGLIEKNNKGISIKLDNGNECILSGGIISKIIYDNIRPSNMGLTILGTLNESESGNEEITTDNN